MDLVSWQHRVKECLDVFVGVILVEGADDVIESIVEGDLGVWLSENVEALHHGSSVVERLGRLRVGELLPDLVLLLDSGDSGGAGESTSQGQVGLILSQGRLEEA